MTRDPRLPVEFCRFVTTDRAELSTSVRYAFTADAVDVLCAFRLAARKSEAGGARPAAARFTVATPVVQE